MGIYREAGNAIAGYTSGIVGAVKNTALTVAGFRKADEVSKQQQANQQAKSDYNYQKELTNINQDINAINKSADEALITARSFEDYNARAKQIEKNRKAQLNQIRRKKASLNAYHKSPGGVK